MYTGMKCPKCKGNVFREDIDEGKVLYCLSCGLRGKSLDDMKSKISEINRIVAETERAKIRKYDRK